MNKSLKLEYIIVLAFIVINVTLVSKLLQARKQLQLMEVSAVSNYIRLQHRIVDNIRISKMSYDIDFFEPNKLITLNGSSQKFTDLKNGYYVFINYYGCRDCIEGALTTIKGLDFDELMYFGGNFDSLNAWLLFMKDNNIKPENGYYCYGVSSSLILNEETPVIIHILDGRIVDSCVIDGSFPVEYYKYFLSK